MEPSPQKNELAELVIKIVPPFLLSVMAKLASEYKKGKKVSWLSSLVVVCLAGCSSIVGYWITQLIGWTEYKMVLTIFFFGLFSDKLFDFLFSTTAANMFFNFIEDWIKMNLNMLLKVGKNKEK